MNCCSDPYKNTVFWKSMMRSFRWIEINCFSRFRFLAEVSTNLQKMHYFGQFKDHNSGRKKEIRQMTLFFIYFLSSVCDIHFCIWKLSKFIFMGSSLCLFWSAKYLNLAGASCEIWNLPHSNQETYTLKKVKNQVLLFLLKTKFVWSLGLLLSVPECYFE